MTLMEIRAGRRLFVFVSFFLFLPIVALSQSCSITKTLSFGSRDPEVLCLQGFLVTQKLFLAENSTGYFGPLTEKAVQNFQSANGIVSSGSPSSTGYGVVGPKTRALINSYRTSKIATTTQQSPDIGQQGGGSSEGAATSSVSMVDCANRANKLERQCSTVVYQSEFERMRNDSSGGWMDPSDKTVPATKTAKDAAELRSLAPGLRPGDIVDVLSGVDWVNEVVTIHATGTKESPIVIRTKTGAGVTLKDNSSITLGGKYLVLEGFRFSGVFNGTSAVTLGTRAVPCEHCTAANLTFDSYNPTASTTANYHVLMRGQWNRITQSTFRNKTGTGAVISASGMSRYPTGDYYLIDNNAFIERPACARSCGGTIALHSDEKGTVVTYPDGSQEGYWADSYSYIRNNYFQDQRAAAQLLTLKVGKVGIQNNTFSNSGGSITLRTSNSSVLEGNVFSSTVTSDTITGGIRLIGKNHAVVHNIFMTLDPHSDKGVYPIALNVGDQNPVSGLEYQYVPVTNTVSAFNLLTQNTQNISIGVPYNPRKPSPTSPYTGFPALVMPSSQNHVAYNVLFAGSRTDADGGVYINTDTTIVDDERPWGGTNTTYTYINPISTTTPIVHDNVSAGLDSTPHGFTSVPATGLLRYDTSRLVHLPGKPEIYFIEIPDRTLYRRLYDAFLGMTSAEKTDILDRMQYVNTHPGRQIPFVRYSSANVGNEVGARAYRSAASGQSLSTSIDILSGWVGSGATFATTTAPGRFIFTEKTNSGQHQANNYITLPTGYSLADSLEFSMRARVVNPSGQRIKLFLHDKDNVNTNYAATLCVPAGVSPREWKSKLASSVLSSTVVESGGWHRCKIQTILNASGGGKQLRVLLLSERSDGQAVYTGATTTVFEIEDMSLTITDTGLGLENKKTSNFAAVLISIANAVEDLFKTLGGILGAQSK